MAALWIQHTATSYIKSDLTAKVYKRHSFCIVNDAQKAAMNPDTVASIAAALDAGKLPSQKQISTHLGFLQTFLQRAQAGASNVAESAGQNDVGRLSEQGSILVKDIENILEAYKQLGQEKNSDDVVQEALWSLAQSDVDVNLDDSIQRPEGTASKDEANADARRLAHALHSLSNVFLGNVVSSGSPLFADFLSFLRLSLADVAEGIENTARGAKENIKNIDEEVNKGQRTAVGFKTEETKQAQAPEGVDYNDPQYRFEKGMDTAKHYGSSAIGTGQQIRGTVQARSAQSRDKILDAFDKTLQQFQSDPEYSEAIDTLFDLADKWVNKSLDMVDQATEAAQKSSVESNVNDQNGQFSQAMRHFNTFIERLAGGKSTETLQEAVKRLGRDLKSNQEGRDLLSEAIAFARRSLHDSEFVDSEEFDKQKDSLVKRWRSMVHAQTAESKRLSTDLQAVQDELDVLTTGMKEDKALNNLKNAHERLAKDLAKAAADAGMAGQVGVGMVPWLLKDLLNVYLPLLIDYVKQIPIPRTEYKDSDVEFVVEDLSIETLRVLPGHAHLSTTVDMDVDKPTAAADAKTDISTRTKLEVTGVQMQLREVSFWYSDPSLPVASQVSGLMDITIPPKGVDISASLGLIPTASGRHRRERHGGFHKISNVSVTLSDDTSIGLRKTNHPVLISTFKPIVKKRLISTIEQVLAEKIKMVLEMIDGIAWDTHLRAEVFADAGLTGTVPKYIAGFVSEMGKLRKQPGLLSGWKATGIGLVKDDPRDDVVLAVGAGPQVISGDKHGPRNTASSTNAAQAKVDSVKSQAPGGKSTKADAAKSAVAQAKSFAQTVQSKAEEEKQHPGWRSKAFDL